LAVKIDITRSDNETIIAVEGEVDLYSSPELREAVLKAVPKAENGLAIDLAEVSYMDSSGVATLVEGLRSANQNDTLFVLIRPSSAVMKVLELARLDRVFDVRPDG
jgi:anti-sigma B factor antagonist